jgi:hypothetical protein
LTGLSVDLNNESAIKPYFTVPEVDQAGEALEFELTVTDAAGLKCADTVMINVTNENDPPQDGDEGGGGGSGGGCFCSVIYEW